MIIENPILRGFHPDPSAVQVGEDYYIATSTFEWWPGIDIYHSKDLLNWEWVYAPLTRKSQVDLLGNYNSGSIWAPNLTYHNGKFYLVYTDVKSATAFKDTLNYIITAESIAGPWSEPTFVTASGFDPALFHDDDGKHYFLNMLFDWRPDRPNFSGTVIQEFDINTMELVDERKHFYKGNSLGVCEGPQILKKDGYYYLLCAAGGTGYGHAATVARSKSLWGPYEESPFFPLLTAADDSTIPLQKSGHASFLQKNEDWYIVHLCARPLQERGNCPLGRETAIQKIVWESGWPRLKSNTHHPDSMVSIPGTQKQIDNSEYIDFSTGSLPHTLKTIRGSLTPGKDYTFTGNKLRLYGRQSLSSLHKQTLFARRWQSFHFSVETEVHLHAKSFHQTTGLILFYDTENWIYQMVYFDEENQVYILQLMVADLRTFRFASEAIVLSSHAPVKLKAEVCNENVQFYFAEQNSAFLPLGTPLPAHHLSDDYIEKMKRMAFTGAMIGICCQDMDDHSAFADFTYFYYEETIEKSEGGI